MFVKKKHRFDFYKAIQVAGFQTTEMQEKLALGLDIPVNEMGQVLAFINNLGSALKNIHDTMSEAYAQAPTPLSSTG